MSSLTLRVAQDETMPNGRCVILVNDDIVYIGKLGSPMLAYLDMPDALIILSPEDFASGMSFMRMHRWPN